MIHLIEAVFQKDFATEYMIITMASEESKDNHYDIHVIQNNIIEGLLKLQVRDVNQEMQYFYDIKGYISMAELQEREKYTGGIIVKIMMDLNCCMAMLDEYLLDKDALYLDEHFIYYHTQTQRCAFTYIPGHCQSVKEQMKTLISWMMKHIDYGRKADVNLVYELYRKVENDEDYMQMFGGDDFEQREQQDIRQDLEMNPYITSNQYLPKNQHGKLSQYVGQNQHKKSRRYFDSLQKAKTKAKPENIDGNGKVNVKANTKANTKANNISTNASVESVNAIANGETVNAINRVCTYICIGTGVAGGVSFLFRKALCIWFRTQRGIVLREMLLPFIFLICCAGMGIVLIILQLKQRQNSGSEKESKGMHPLTDEKAMFSKPDSFENGDNLIDGHTFEYQYHYENSISKHKDNSSYKNRLRHKDKDDFWDEEPSIDYLEICKNQTSVLQKQTPFSETVVLENHTILQLVSMMTGEVIVVSFYPFTIGKNEKVVQYCIDSDVVSRRHVQLTKENQKYYITDLHSTNGTWVNDKQLMPGRAYELHQGETVKIADICYEVKIE